MTILQALKQGTESEKDRLYREETEREMKSIERDYDEVIGKTQVLETDKELSDCCGSPISLHGLCQSCEEQA